jgi:hypothetical protein
MDDVDQTKGRGIGDGIDRKIALGHIDDGGVGGIADGKAKGKAIFFRLDFVALPFGRLKLAFGKIFPTFSFEASVATSKDVGALPRRISRTDSPMI